MKHTVQILATQRREAVYEGGRKSISFVCQTVVFGDTVEVGVLRVSEAMAKSFLTEDGQMPVGFYDLEYGLAVSFKDRSVGGQLKSIAPSTFKGKGFVGVPPSVPEPVKA